MVIPAPASVQTREGTFSPSSVSGHGADYASTVLGLPVSESGDLRLELVDGPHEAYNVTVDSSGIRITGSPAGLFYGVQTLRQLGVDGAFPAIEIADSPRFDYRGAMLDVARHFFSVSDVKRFIDAIAQLKINHLHLHLSDDQGWRIQIETWPNLTAVGAQTSVNGDGGGFYTQAEYGEIVDYAASRFVTVVPEIDMPGHTNAALASYPELTSDGIAPALYEGMEVGFSTLTIGSERTYDFVADVVGELAAITPGPLLHIGGDESLSTTSEDFLTFAKRVGQIVAATGKTLVGWHELGKSSELPAGSIGQYWGFTTPEGDSAEEALSFVRAGGRLILSPADVVYLDIKYDEATALGLDWAHGPTSLEAAASWEPTAIIPGVGDEQILGIEAPVWSETLVTIDDVEFMAFPRLAAVAEIAWSPRVDAASRFASLRDRLPDLGARLEAAGTNFYRAPGVDWR